MDQCLREICHLYRAAGFGAGPDALRRGVRQGYEATVSELVGYYRTPHDVEEPELCTVIPLGISGGLVQVARLIGWWVGRMVTTGRPLEEKLTLFWHGHFTTAAMPVFSSGLLLAQNRLFRQLGAGRFDELLQAVGRDPAMLIYLDGHLNRKAHPNENFAREVMELFTLGPGHYSEHDVREAARAFTGWTVGFPQGRFRFDAAQHDGGEKTVLGLRGRLTGEDVLKLLARHPATARHVSGRLFRFFAGEEPSRQTADHLVARFRRHHGHILPVVEAIFLSPQFRAAAQRRSALCSPLEFMVGAHRAVGEVFSLWRRWDPLKTIQAMGQVPFNPPTVAGWRDGHSWINTSTLLERLNFVSSLVDQLDLGDRLAVVFGADAPERLLWQLGIPDAGPGTRKVLATCWRRFGDPVRLLKLGLASPEFSLR